MLSKLLAKRLEKINPSQTLAITSKAKKLKSEEKDIVNFAGGEPDFDTPDFIKDAASVLPLASRRLKKEWID